MKYFYIILSICFFLVSGNAYASTLSGDLLEIQNKIGTGYVNDYYNSVPYYDISRLDQDIKRKQSDWENSEPGMPENSIQRSSKEKWWKKQNFLNFVNALKTKDTKNAVKLYEKHSDTISPFLPTCCAFQDYISHKPLKNGILSLVISGNGLISYSLTYTFYKHGILYETEMDTGFGSDINEEYKILKYSKDSVYTKDDIIYKSKIKKNSSYFDENYNEIIKTWFNTPSKNKIFEEKYKSFLSDMSKLWK